MSDEGCKPHGLLLCSQCRSDKTTADRIATLEADLATYKAQQERDGEVILRQDARISELESVVINAASDISRVTAENERTTKNWNDLEKITERFFTKAREKDATLKRHPSLLVNAMAMHILKIEAERDAALVVNVETVIAAILSVDKEAARRGKMFPQTHDEQRDDRRAVARVIGMLRWYEGNTGCSNIKDWPTNAARKEGA